MASAASTDIQNLVVVGAGGVGKSCLTVRFLKDEFSSEYDPTIEENYRKNITVDGKPLIVNIVDTAGQDEFKALRDQHFETGEGFLLIYAINDATSFEEVKSVRESIMARRNSSKVPFVVVGNKCDMESGRKVGQEQAKEWATSIKAPFLETSAKASIRVTDAFHVLVREVWRQRKKTVAAKKKSRCLVM